MNKIRTLIVDDERLARGRLRRLLGAYPGFEVVGESVDGNAAVETVRSLKPELLLLDVQMPGMDGFEVVEAIGPAPLPVVVFVTAYDEHALRAFDACALDYLLKPVSAERLEKTITRVAEFVARLREEEGAAAKQGVAEGKRYHVRSGQRTSFVSPEEIDWIEADGNYAILHVGSRSHLLRATMAALERELPATFMRTSRSAIVNLRRVKELQAVSGSHCAVMHDEARVPVTVGMRTIQQRLRDL